MKNRTVRKISQNQIVLFSLLLFIFVTLSIDSYLLHRTYQYFGGGALNRPFALTSHSQIVVFFMQSLFYGLVFYGSAAYLLYRGVFGRLGFNFSGSIYLTFVFLLVFVFIYSVAKWKLWSYFRNQFDFSVLQEIAGGKLSNLFAWISPWQFIFVIFGVLFIVLNFFFVKWLSKKGKSAIPLSRSVVSLIYFGWGALVVNHFLISEKESLRYGLEKQIAFLLPDKTLHYAIDFDGDGFSVLSTPPDPDNWDSGINPYAVDIPGNGIDENGLAGDLSTKTIENDSIDYRVNETPKPMNVIVVVVETFRADIIEMDIDGKQVMPFLQSLGKKHAYTNQAYSNFGITGRSIQSIFAGNLHFNEGGRFLFDAFRDAGYRIYAVSAQPESWGKTDRILRLHDLDYFWDARELEIDESRLTLWQRMNPESLNANWRQVNDKAFQVLEQNGDNPFFLYLNYQELHYPYFSGSMEKIFIDKPRTEAEFFSSENRDQILRQYANAARNLDRGFENLIDFLGKKNILDKTVLIIVGDHPDSFYENGLLGHGWTIDHHQRQIPLIVVNGTGIYDTPVGQDEIAEIIVHSVNHTEDSRVSFIENSDKKVFVITGPLERPKKLGFINETNLFSFDFNDNLFKSSENNAWLSPGAWRTLEEKKNFNQLINKWELELLKKTYSQIEKMED